MKNFQDRKKTDRQAAFFKKTGQVLLVFLLMLFLCSTVQAQTHDRNDNGIDKTASVALLPMIKGQNPEGQGQTLTCPMGRFCEDDNGLKDEADQILTDMVQAKLLQRLDSRAVSREIVQKAYDSAKYGFEKKTPLDLVMEVGEKLNVEYMLVGNVWRYQQRIGSDYGAAQPASVAFALYLVEVSNGEVLWSQTFAETQQSLSENLLKAKKFFRRGAKWLTAKELAKAGVNEVMDTFPVY
ncbi:MAG: hypothetical protein KFF46_00050 [Desulfobacterales bacterium]|nr:hypothetical protein [Desulfobacterales bacterium]